MFQQITSGAHAKCNRGRDDAAAIVRKLAVALRTASGYTGSLPEYHMDHSEVTQAIADAQAWLSAKGAAPVTPAGYLLIPADPHAPGMYDALTASVRTFERCRESLNAHQALERAFAAFIQHAAFCAPAESAKGAGDK